MQPLFTGICPLCICLFRKTRRFTGISQYVGHFRKHEALNKAILFVNITSSLLWWLTVTWHSQSSSDKSTNVLWLTKVQNNWCVSSLCCTKWLSLGFFFFFWIMLKLFAKAPTTIKKKVPAQDTFLKFSATLKIATKLKCWGFLSYFIVCVCLSRIWDTGMGGWGWGGVGVGMDLTGEWGTSSVREWEHRVGGLHREGKGTSLSAPLEGWNSSRAVPPIWQALVKTIPQLLVTLQIQLPFPLWREREWEAIQIDRIQREKERRVLIGLDRCRGQLSSCAILISYEGCLAVQAHRLVWFCVCALQQRPLQWLNEELVNMHEGRTLPFTSVTSPDALAQRKMERNGKSKTLNSYLVPMLLCFSLCN